MKTITAEQVIARLTTKASEELTQLTREADEQGTIPAFSAANVARHIDRRIAWAQRSPEHRKIAIGDARVALENASKRAARRAAEGLSEYLWPNLELEWELLSATLEVEALS